MKRYLQKNRHQLNLSEQESIWRSIQEKTGREGSPTRRRGFFLPAFGWTTVTAAVLLGAVWFGQKDAPDKIASQVRDEARQNATRTQTELPVKIEVLPEVLPEAEAEVPPPPAGDILGGKEVIGKENQAIPEKQPADPASQQTKSPNDSNRLENAPPPPATQPADKPVAAPDKIAIESVEEALNKQVGVEMKKGELYVRGGRSGELLMDLDSAIAKRSLPPTASAPAPQPGSVTGGTTPPNGQKFELMYHEHTGVNPFVATDEDALSTFAVDVDNASYTLARSYLQRGVLPPKDAIRVEEFVNFFGGGYPAQTDEVFKIHTDGSPSRFGQGYHMLRVGLKGMDIDAQGRKPANLIFVIDTSGSMNRENRLGLVKKSLHILVDELGEGDRVGIVTYGSRGQVVLKPTDLSRKDQISAAIDRLQPSGATNACEGLELAYGLARQDYDATVLNRLVLCSDGVANMGGSTRAEQMLAQVRRSSDEGITLSAIGFGMGNYNDVLMEKLADQGDGNYFYVDKLDESERVFRANLTGMLQTIAREVKIQVEFDPDRVQRWRLLGYENRDVADRDFRNDNVDAGEVGAGHEVTALYELKLKSETDDTQFADEVYSPTKLGTVRVRYEYPAHDTQRAGQVEEIQHDFTRQDLNQNFANAAAAYRLQAVAAEFAEILRGSFWARESDLADLIPLAHGLAQELEGQKDLATKAGELIGLIRQAADLQAAREAEETPGGYEK